MKYLFTLLLFGALLFQPEEVKAQEANKVVFAEILGNGILASFNYDMRFGSTNDGLGARIGIGYVGGLDASVTTVPIMVNYLLGKEGKYFEIGAGATYANGSVDIGDGGNGDGFAGTLSFMYRSQPVDGGFMWKIGITPLFGDGFFVPYWLGIGLGYAF